MRILLITLSDAGGHHNEYKKLIGQAIYDLGHEVLHFSLAKNKAKEFHNSLPVFLKKFKCFSYINKKYKKYRTKLWQNRQGSIINLQILSGHIQQLHYNLTPPDLLFFESLDSFAGHYLTKWDINNKLSIPFCGILVSPSDPKEMTKSIFRKGLLNPYHFLRSEWCISVGVLVEEAIHFMSELIHKPVIELPDIVTIPESISDNTIGESIRKSAGRRFVIGIWGSLEQRKGISDFLQMCLKLSSEKYFFVMGGQIHSESWSENDKEILAQSYLGFVNNLVVFDQWLTEDQLLSGMHSCDLIFAAYPKWIYSSGIIGKSAALKVPILVNDGYIMAKRVNDFNIGFVKNEHEDVSIWVSRNINLIKELRTSDSFKEGCFRYCERFGYEQWRKSLAHLIEFTNFNKYGKPV